MINTEQNKAKTEEKLTDDQLDELDDKLTQLDCDLTALNNEHDIAVDFITEWALENLDLADYDMIIQHMIANRRLHDEVPSK